MFVTLEYYDKDNNFRVLNININTIEELLSYTKNMFNKNPILKYRGGLLILSEREGFYE